MIRSVVDSKFKEEMELLRGIVHSTFEEERPRWLDEVQTMIATALDGFDKQLVHAASVENKPIAAPSAAPPQDPPQEPLPGNSMGHLMSRFFADFRVLRRVVEGGSLEVKDVMERCLKLEAWAADPAMAHPQSQEMTRRLQQQVKDVAERCSKLESWAAEAPAMSHPQLEEMSRRLQQQVESSEEKMVAKSEWWGERLCELQAETKDWMGTLKEGVQKDQQKLAEDLKEKMESVNWQVADAVQQCSHLVEQFWESAEAHRVEEQVQAAQEKIAKDIEEQLQMRDLKLAEDVTGRMETVRRQAADAAEKCLLVEGQTQQLHEVQCEKEKLQAAQQKMAEDMKATQQMAANVNHQLAAESKARQQLARKLDFVCRDFADLRDLFDQSHCGGAGDRPEEQTTRTEEAQEPQPCASEFEGEDSTQQCAGGDRTPAETQQGRPTATPQSAGGTPPAAGCRSGSRPTEGARGRRDPPAAQTQSRGAATTPGPVDATRPYFELPAHPDDPKSRTLTLNAEGEILEALRRNASREEKSRVIKNLQLKLHPDKGGTDKAFQWLGEWKKQYSTWFMDG